jgi:lipid-A-disaccharide synthase
MNNLPYVGLPNVLAGKFIVPELLQKQATPQKIADEISKLLIDKDNVKAIKEEFIKMHIALKQDSAKKAADVVLSYL